MNTNILKYLVNLVNGEIKPVDAKIFFERFSEDSSSHDLYSLEKLGFISLLRGDGHIQAIGVNKKAIDFVKNASS